MSQTLSMVLSVQSYIDTIDDVTGIENNARLILSCAAILFSISKKLIHYEVMNLGVVFNSRVVLALPT